MITNNKSKNMIKGLTAEIISLEALKKYLNYQNINTILSILQIIFTII